MTGYMTASGQRHSQRVGAVVVCRPPWVMQQDPHLVVSIGPHASPDRTAATQEAEAVLVGSRVAVQAPWGPTQRRTQLVRRSSERWPNRSEAASSHQDHRPGAVHGSPARYSDAADAAATNDLGRCSVHCRTRSCQRACWLGTSRSWALLREQIYNHVRIRGARRGSGVGSEGVTSEAKAAELRGSSFSRPSGSAAGPARAS